MKLTDGFNLLATAPDGIKRLRELILSLAVQGKLVPQDASDEPASELLKQIRAEKDCLIADGKIKQDKLLPAIGDDEKPFELPDGWEWALLGDVINVIRGITFPANEKTREAATGRIACLRTTNVQSSIEWDDLLYVDRSFMGREEQVIQLHDIVMSMANSRELVGKVAIINSIPVDEATFGGFLSVLRPHLVSAQYAMIILRTEYARNSLIDSASQTTNIANISLTKLRPLPIPLPPLTEQSRIVAKVEELMTLCDALETRGVLEAKQHARLTATLFDALAASESAHQLQENWTRLAQSFDLILDRPAAVDALEQTLLQLAVRGLLVEQDPNDEPASELLKQIRLEKDRLIAEGKIKKDKPLLAITDDEKPFELPYGWEWARFAQVADIASNLVSPAQYLNFQQVAPDLIEKNSGRLIGRRTVSEAGVTSSNHLFNAGQILYSKIRPSLSKAVIVNFDGLCSADMYPINAKIEAEYLHQFILSQIFLNQVWVAENRVKMPKLNQEALNSFLVAVPPLAEQSRIVARVEVLRTLCADLRQRLTASQKIQIHLAETLVEQCN